LQPPPPAAPLHVYSGIDFYVLVLVFEEDLHKLLAFATSTTYGSTARLQWYWFLCIDIGF
jgi:hypothetical protein